MIFKEKGYKILVDKKDAHLLTNNNFHVKNSENEKCSIRVYVFVGNNTFLKWPYKTLANLIYPDIGKNNVIDHINGDPLDNRRKNLRICSKEQNQFNKRLYKNNTSGYKGVRFEKDRNKWAAVCIANKKKFIKRFINKEDAIQFYNETAKKIHGEFAQLNVL